MSTNLSSDGSHAAILIQEDGYNTEQFGTPNEDIHILSEFQKQLMEEDKILSHEEERASKLLDCLQAKCQNEREKFRDEKLMEVSRSNCLQDLLAIYKRDEIMQSKVTLVFKACSRRWCL